jgi:uncharacterized protein YecT (DUF1311 family)
MAQEPQPIPSKGRVNPTLIALIGGLAVLLLVIAFFATRPNPDQDKLSDEQVNLVQPEATGPQKLCSSKATFDAIKRELFRRAAKVRRSDQATFDRLAAYAVARMENPVMESEDGASGAANCSGSLSLDLPPGVAVAGGRRSLSADVDYRVDPGGNVELGNADAIVTPLSTLTRVDETPEPIDDNLVSPEENVAASESAAVEPGPPSSYPGRPSFDCSRARTRGEIAVCADSSLSALDLNMTTQYRRALGKATPQQHDQLQATRNRFLAFRDSCPTRQCIADAYVGRMREIRDIMEGRWQPAR